MQSTISHIYLYVPDVKKSYQFYKKLLKFLGYRQTTNKEWGFAFTNQGTSLWFEKTPEGYVKDGYHRKRTGLNHLAFKVGSKEEVNHFFEKFLKPNDIPTLYETPKAFPEYNASYYAVFFEDPDRLKLEVNYHA